MAAVSGMWASGGFFIWGAARKRAPGYPVAGAPYYPCPGYRSGEGLPQRFCRPAGGACGGA